MTDMIQMERSAKAAVWRKQRGPAPVINDIDWNAKLIECERSDALAMIACASSAGTTILKLIPGEGDYLKWVATGTNRWKRVYFGEHGEANSLMWCPTNGRLLASGSDCGKLSIIEYQSAEGKFNLKASFKVHDGISGLTWSIHGLYLVVSTKSTSEVVIFKKETGGDGDGSPSFKKLGTIKLSDQKTGTPIRLSIVPAFPYVLVTYSPQSISIKLLVMSKEDPLGWKLGSTYNARKNVIAVSTESDNLYTLHKGDRVNSWVVTSKVTRGSVSYGLTDKGWTGCGHSSFVFRTNSKASKHSEANAISTVRQLPSKDYYQVTTGTTDTLVASKGFFEKRSGDTPQYKIVHQHRDHVMLRGQAYCVKINPLQDAHMMHAAHGGDGGFLHFWYMGKENMPKNRVLERLDEDYYYEEIIPETAASFMPPDDQSDDQCHVLSVPLQSDEENTSSKDDDSTAEKSSSSMTTEPTTTSKGDDYSPGSSVRQSIDDGTPVTLAREGIWHQPDLTALLERLVDKCSKSSEKRVAAVKKVVAKHEDVMMKKKADLQTQLSVFMSEADDSLQSCAAQFQNMEEMQDVNELKRFASELVGKLKLIEEKCNAEDPELSEKELAFRQKISEICKPRKELRYGRQGP